MNKTILFICIILPFMGNAQLSKEVLEPKHEILENLLGIMPNRNPLQIDTLEKVEIDGGMRFKIKYFIEPGNPKLNTPDDWGYAYLFIPFLHKGEKRPAIIANHQDDIYFTIGKSEPAGLKGDSTMFYGKELFERGYIVLCPDRFYHADRRETNQNWHGVRGDLSEENYGRDYDSFDKRRGVLLAEGRNLWGKEAYDFSRAVDVLVLLPEVDINNIGAIGHSAGANTLSYSVFYDPRIKAAVANCGISEINAYFNYDRPGIQTAGSALPGSILNNIDTHDYIAGIAPRALFISSGAHQWGDGRPDPYDIHFAQELETFKNAYLNAGGIDIVTNLFEENAGRHSFPSGIKEQAYSFLDKYLKGKNE